MLLKEFLSVKVNLLGANPDTGMPNFAPALKKMIDSNKQYDVVTLEAGGLFELRFRAIDLENDTLVICAERQETIRPEYWAIDFKGAGNIQLLLNVDNEGLMNKFASYSVRGYANHPHYPSKRVRVATFHAPTEIQYYLTRFCNKYALNKVRNHYIEDNKLKYDLAVRNGKTPTEAANLVEGTIMKKCGMPHCFVNEGRERVYWFHDAKECERYAKR